DLAEQFVPEHERPADVRRDAEEALGDLAVGPAHAHLEHADRHLAVGRVDALDARRVRNPRLGDECTRHAVQVSVDLLIDVHARLAEGPRWDAAGGRLLWVDIEGETLHAYDGRDLSVPVGAMLGSCAPCDDGDVLLSLQDRLALLSGETLVDFP